MDASSDEPHGLARSSPLSRATITKVGLPSLLSAAVSYVFTLVAARTLGSVEENTRLLTFLSLLFACYGVLSGVATEMIRAVATASLEGHSRGPRALSVALTLALGSAVAVAFASPLSAHVLGEPDDAMLLILPIGIAGYVVHSALVGASSGRGNWSVSGLVISAEGLMRLLCVLGVAVVGSSTTRLAVAAVVGAWAWVLLLAAPRVRNTLLLRLDASPAVAFRRILVSMLAQGASAMLILGFPVLLSLTTPAREFAGAAPFVLAMTLTRAPLLIPLNALQGLVISAFVIHGTLSFRSRRWVAGLGAACLCMVLLAGLAGPWLMSAIYGVDYRIDGATLAALTVAAMALALLTLTGAACQAAAAHRAFLTGWALATGGACLILLFPADMQTRACAALIAGPAFGMVVHLVGLRRTGHERGARSGL